MLPDSKVSLESKGLLVLPEQLDLQVPLVHKAIKVPRALRV